jgi:hypothetical protein
MIELIKTKYLEIILIIEAAIISTIQNSISKLINTGIPFESNCIYDAAIFGGEENIVSGKIIMSLGDEESISERKGIIFLALDEDSYGLINCLLEKKKR